MMLRKLVVPAIAAMLVMAASTSEARGDEGDETTKPSRESVQDRSRPYAVRHTKDPLELIRSRVTSKKAILLDVREQDEWDAGHLRHAVLLPLSELKEIETDKEVQGKVGKYSKDTILYCHCKGGGRVLPATLILRARGYDIRPLKEGYERLLKAGFEKAPEKKETPEKKEATDKSGAPRKSEIDKD